MMEPVTTTHAAIAMLVAGYLALGLVFGYLFGASRAEKRGYEQSRALLDAEREYWTRKFEGVARRG